MGAKTEAVFDLVGWKDIAAQASLSLSAAQRAAGREVHPMPVYTRDGMRMVVARTSEIDEWVRSVSAPRARGGAR